jgi:hypothetical protein
MAAGPRLEPSEVRGSDCIAVQITTLKPPNTTFFTDHCAGPKDPVFIGLDGAQHPLQRVEGDYNAYPFQGKFVGQGLVVVVKPIRLLKRELLSKQPDAEHDYRSSSFEVEVSVSSGGASRAIRGTMSQ